MTRLLFTVLLVALATSAAAQSHPVFFNDATSLARYSAMVANYNANPSNPGAYGGKIIKYMVTQSGRGSQAAYELRAIRLVSLPT